MTIGLDTMFASHFGGGLDRAAREYYGDEDEIFGVGNGMVDPSFDDEFVTSGHGQMHHEPHGARGLAVEDMAHLRVVYSFGRLAPIKIPKVKFKKGDAND